MNLNKLANLSIPNLCEPLLLFSNKKHVLLVTSIFEDVIKSISVLITCVEFALSGFFKTSVLLPPDRVFLG
jgi:hypothetical protein